MNELFPGLDTDALLAAGALSPLDVELPRALSRITGEVDPLVLLGAAAAASSVRRGHVCAELDRLGGAPILDGEGAPVGRATWPARGPWEAALRRSPIVGDGSGEPRPLVLDAEGRLYTHRYWEHERALATALSQRMSAGPPEPIDEAVLQGSLRRLFAGMGEGAEDQRAAVEKAVRRRFTVISGGPGTGKTTTVIRLLVALIEQALARGARPPRLLLVAPTGKAAARLVESIRGAKARLDCSPEVKALIPEEARTLHRALGTTRGSTTLFRHDADDPLPAELVLVDESSMVDLALLRRLVDAVPPEARLLLLGDPDQLVSVEAGAILGDICAAGGEAVAALRVSWRFDATRGIGILARAIRDGDAEGALAVLQDPQHPDVSLAPPLSGGALGPGLTEAVLRGWRPVEDAVDPADKLRALEHFRVLAAHRRGALGVIALNRQVERALQAEGRLRPVGPWYPGRPVMVTENDYGVELFNGDVGLLTAQRGQGLRACFFGADSQVRALAPSRLPPVETVFAMSVHKSQGSEFDEVALVLPDRPSPLLSRELIYTAVTRARLRVVIHARPEIIAAGVRHRIQRASGLVAALRRGTKG
jgi:exodeoxyribonuclease V alpha subunit